MLYIKLCVQGKFITQQNRLKYYIVGHSQRILKKWNVIQNSYNMLKKQPYALETVI